MILAVDVSYSGSGARAAGLLFETWDSDTFARKILVAVDGVAQYVPGMFYERELPCIERVLSQVSEPLSCIVVDGYVALGRHNTPGLGMKLWESLGGTTPIIGVAKSPFADTPNEARLYRGGSSRPLFVTAAGMSVEEAKARILRMRGNYRLPDLLRAVDAYSRVG